MVARCSVCREPAAADCCGNPVPLVVETTHGHEVVCPECFTPVEVCMADGCDGEIVAVPSDAS